MAHFNLGKHWDQVESGRRDEWPVGPAVKNWLNRIAPEIDSKLLDKPGDVDATMALRKDLQPHLRSERRDKTCCWIIKGWGGIKRGDNELLAQTFRAFSKPDVDLAIKELDNKTFRRISSWSKLASFAFPEQFAIFDSRTAAAVNCIMMKANLAPGFYVPPANGSKKKNPIIKYRNKISASPGRSLSYKDFNTILQTAVTESRSLLAVEMALFANSKEICQRQMEERC